MGKVSLILRQLRWQDKVENRAVAIRLQPLVRPTLRVEGNATPQLTPVLTVKPTPPATVFSPAFVFFPVFALRRLRQARLLSPPFVFFRFRVAATPLGKVTFPDLCPFFPLLLYSDPAQQCCFLWPLSFFRFHAAVTPPSKVAFSGLCLFLLLLDRDSAQQGCFPRPISFSPLSLGGNSARQNRLGLPINFLKSDPAMQLLSRSFSSSA